MNNKIELTDWELLALKEFHVRLENGVMSDESGKEKIVFKKININPYLLKAGEQSKDTPSNQKIELHFEGYNRHIVITRYGNVPGPLTITVGKRETYGTYVQEYQGLRKVELFHIENNKKVSMEAIPCTSLPNDNNCILVTRLSNIHDTKQLPKYTTYINCTANEIRIDDKKIDNYWDCEEINKPFEVNKENYESLLHRVIGYKFRNEDTYQREGFFTQDGIPFLLDAFERVEAYYCDDIMAHKVERVNVQYGAKLDAINKERDQKVLEINDQKDQELSKLLERHKVLSKVKETYRNK